MTQELKTKVEFFEYDHNLLYLIQRYTSEPTYTIVGYFFDLSVKMTMHAVNRGRGGRHLHKKTVEYYPNTTIPFKLEITGWRDSFEKGERGVSAKLSFPSQMGRIKGDKIEDKLLSINVLGEIDEMVLVTPTIKPAKIDPRPREVKAIDPNLLPEELKDLIEGGQ